MKLLSDPKWEDILVFMFFMFNSDNSGCGPAVECVGITFVENPQKL